MTVQSKDESFMYSRYLRELTDNPNNLEHQNQQESAEGAIGGSTSVYMAWCLLLFPCCLPTS